MLLHAEVIISVSIFKDPRVNTSSSKKTSVFTDISFSLWLPQCLGKRIVLNSEVTPESSKEDLFK